MYTKNIKNIIRNKYYFIYFFLCFSSLLISFSFNEDGHGTGASGDFKDTWNYVLQLKNKSVFEVNPIQWTRHFPLHYYILSLFLNFTDNKEFIRFIFCISSTLIPFLFYKILILKNNKCNFKIVIILSSIIFFIPAFRYLSIWANAHITASIFFLYSIFYYTKYYLSKNKNIFYLLLHIFFIFLASYTIQYYAIFMLFFFIYYFSFKINKNFFIIICTIIICSLPGIFFINKFPDHFSSIKTNFYLSNVVLSNTSMISIYLIPIIFINYIFNKDNFYNKSLLIAFLISFLITLVCAFYFEPNKWIIGGGIPFAISKILFDNNILFFFFSFLGSFSLILFSQENFKNLVLSFLSIFIFLSDTLYQRYYEPLFYIIIFLLFNSKFLIIFKKKLIYGIFLLVYYLIYYLLASSEILYLL